MPRPTATDLFSTTWKMKACSLRSTPVAWSNAGLRALRRAAWLWTAPTVCSSAAGAGLVVSAEDGQVITTLPIGDHVDATAFDPETKLIFNSNGDGTISVIHEDSPDKYFVETVKTVPRAKTMATTSTSNWPFSAVERKRR